MKLLMENWRKFIEEECDAGEVEDLATFAHDGQTRRDGQPYITHPAGVAALASEYGYSDAVRDAGWLHDAVEDFEGPVEEIKEMIKSVCPEALPIVLELTHDNSIDYTEYVLGLSKGAVAVKMLDVLYNSQDLTPDSKQYNKYKNALLALGGKPDGITEPHWKALEGIYGALQ